MLHVLAENTAHQDYQVVVDGFHVLGSREESRRSKGAKSAHGGTGVKRRRQYPGAHNEYAVHVPYCRFTGGRTDAVWGEKPSPPLVSFERFLSPLHLPRSFLRLSWASVRRFCSLPSIVATLLLFFFHECREGLGRRLDPFRLSSHNL